MEEEGRADLAENMAEREKPMDTAELPSGMICCKCDKLERLVVELSVARRAQEKLLLSRIQSLEDDLGELKAILLTGQGQLNCSGGDKKAKKKTKKSESRREATQPQSSVPNSNESTHTVGTVRDSSESTQTVGTVRATKPVRGRSVSSSTASLRARAGAPAEPNPVQLLLTGVTSDTTSGSELEDDASEHHSCHQPANYDEKPGIPPLSTAALPELQWQRVTHVRPKAHSMKALYVGKLRRDATSESVSAFVSERLESLGVRETENRCSLLEKSSNEFVGAHLTVHAKWAHLVLDRRFWPKPVYARPWNFKTTSPTDASNASGTSAEDLAENAKSPSHDQEHREQQQQRQQTQQQQQQLDIPHALSASNSNDVVSGPKAAREEDLHQLCSAGSHSSSSQVERLLSEARAGSSAASDGRAPNPSRLSVPEDNQDCGNATGLVPATTNTPFTLAMSPESNWGSSSEPETPCNSGTGGPSAHPVKRDRESFSPNGSSTAATVYAVSKKTKVQKKSMSKHQWR